MLEELTEYGNNVKEEMEFTQSEINIYREPSMEGRKPGFKPRIWNTGRKKHSVRTQPSGCVWTPVARQMGSRPVGPSGGAGPEHRRAHGSASDSRSQPETDAWPGGRSWVSQSQRKQGRLQSRPAWGIRWWPCQKLRASLRERRTSQGGTLKQLASGTTKKGGILNAKWLNCL